MFESLLYAFTSVAEVSIFELFTKVLIRQEIGRCGLVVAARYA